MPGGDGTGPQGQGPLTGRGLCKCAEIVGPMLPKSRTRGQRPRGLGLGKGYRGNRGRRNMP